MEEVLPRCDKRLGALTLKFGGGFCIADAGFSKSGDDCLGIASINWQDPIQRSVIGECKQRLFGNCVDRIRRGECLNVEDIRCCGVFSAGTCPEEALRLSPGTRSL